MPPSPTDPTPSPSHREGLASLLVLDGSMASELERRGADLDHRLWSARLLVEGSGEILAVHRAYLEAGVDVLCSAGYQASLPGFREAGLGMTQAEEAYRRAIRLAFEARDDQRAARAARGLAARDVVVAHSVGPYGAYLADGSEYTGAYGVTREALAAFHRERLDLALDELALHAGDDGCDGWLALETIPSLEEALVLVEALERHPRARAWLAFSCADGAHTCAGDDVGEAARQLAGCEQLVAVGVNCSSPEHLPALLERMRRASPVPLVAYPNSGEHFDAATRGWSGPDRLADVEAQAARWFGAGATLLGGCCRTSPEWIARLARWRDAREAAASEPSG